MPQPISSLPRRGVTLLELAVGLTIMGVAAALVTPVLTSRPSASSPREDVIAGARRQAIRRGEPLRLRVTDRGAWTLSALRDGVVIDSGAFDGDGTVYATVNATANATFDVQIDALGGCVPNRRTVIDPRANAATLPVASFDPLMCRDDVERAR